MSEHDLPAAGAAGPESGGVSFGQRLAAAREAAGMSVGDVAAHLRLHVNQVRAIESGNLAGLPEAAYVRGFVRSYARLVGVDASTLLDDLNRRLAPAPESVVDGMTRTRDYSPVRAAAQERASRMLVLGLSVVALVALGVVGWLATRPSAPTAVETAAPAASSPAAEPAAPAEAPPADATAAPPVEASPAAPAAAVAPAAAGDAAVVLTFSGTSWVEVTDADGRVLMSQLAKSGETHRPQGRLPLTVVVGDAARVAVTVRGEPMNLESVTRANVARFTVK